MYHIELTILIVVFSDINEKKLETLFVGQAVCFYRQCLEIRPNMNIKNGALGPEGYHYPSVEKWGIYVINFVDLGQTCFLT